jgi:hypothetical protein
MLFGDFCPHAAVDPPRLCNLAIFAGAAWSKGGKWARAAGVQAGDPEYQGKRRAT